MEEKEVQEEIKEESIEETEEIDETEQLKNQIKLLEEEANKWKTDY